MEKAIADMEQKVDQEVKDYDLEKSLQDALTEAIEEHTPEVMEKLNFVAGHVDTLLALFIARDASLQVLVDKRRLKTEDNGDDEDGDDDEESSDDREGSEAGESSRIKDEDNDA
jgi:hypothetical protein